LRPRKRSRERSPAADKGRDASNASPRRLALALLDDVLGHNQALDDALAARLSPSKLEPRDRNFARLLVATTLRRLGQIDDLLGAYVKRPLPESAASARNILRLGAAQLVFLETPPHAGVNETVALAAAVSARFKSLVNAVLRKLGVEGKERAAAQDAARLNTSHWLWQSWRKAYGEVETRRIAAAHLAEPPLDLSVRAEAEIWAKRLAAEVLPTGTLRRAAGGPVGELPGYAEGGWWVQDAAAAIPARLLGSVAGRRIVDLCAAPGGKTAQLAAAGAEVIAVDRSSVRLARLQENLDRLKLRAELVPADAAAWRPAQPADAVLLDAPCSATGTIRRHPDLPHRKQARDIAETLAVQARLLDNAATMVRPGGLLVYAVCSLQPEEGPGQIERFLARHTDYALDRVSASALGGCAEFLRPDGAVRTLPSHWPARGGLDGFYVARLRRRRVC
jgi:16S rRNA (cytosine967-C5)-methyltransferase